MEKFPPNLEIKELRFSSPNSKILEIRPKTATNSSNRVAKIPNKFPDSRKLNLGSKSCETNFWPRSSSRNSRLQKKAPRNKALSHNHPSLKLCRLPLNFRVLSRRES